MTGDLTQGRVMPSMLRFAVPMILGNIMQQCYNVADTLIVGQALGKDALAAVGSSFTLMTFITSVILGLCMGSGTVFSIRFGRKDMNGLRETVFISFSLIAVITVVLNILAFLFIDEIIVLLRVPQDVTGPMKEYLFVIFFGIIFVFIYNFFASLLRAVGNSTVPLLFLAASAILNIVLDLWFVMGLDRGVAGAAEATVISQILAGAGIAVYTFMRFFELKPKRPSAAKLRSGLKEIAGYSVLTCVQQSVMNLGILMVQGLVNSFGSSVMAAFAAAVKIDAFAYMPVQDFGNAFSTFIAQNYGAGHKKRIEKGIKGAFVASVLFSVIISLFVCVLAEPLMAMFISREEAGIIAEGVRYLRIEGAFYFAIGGLFLLYGLYRALGRPGMSVVLTVVSLGTRVVLAYLLSSISQLNVVGIWLSVPIGWLLADALGIVYYFLKKRKLLDISSANIKHL